MHATSASRPSFPPAAIQKPRDSSTSVSQVPPHPLHEVFADIRGAVELGLPLAVSEPLLLAPNAPLPWIPPPPRSTVPFVPSDRAMAPALVLKLPRSQGVSRWLGLRPTSGQERRGY